MYFGESYQSIFYYSPKCMLTILSYKVFLNLLFFCFLSCSYMVGKNDKILENEIVVVSSDDITYVDK